MNQPIKNLIFVCLIIQQACSSPTTVEEPVTDNAELQRLKDEDQAARQGDFSTFTAEDWAKMAQGDSIRRLRASQMLDSNLVRTSLDYWNAALIFQHGRDTIDSERTIVLIKKSIALDSTRDKWLLAAAIDRNLSRKGKPQIYGTQYRKNNETGQYEWFEIDPTIISDEERLEYNVGTLEDQRLRMLIMNKKSLQSYLNDGGTIQEIATWSDPSRIESSEYNLTEKALISLGYSLMREEKLSDAEAIFKLSTVLYPNAFNTFDSYGECLLKMGLKDDGIAAYKKSLELNPKNGNAIKVLKELV